MITAPTTIPRPRRRRLQFSLRTLMVLVLVCSVPCGWAAYKLKQAREQREAVRAMMELECEVFYDYELSWAGGPSANAVPPGPSWVRSLVGDDCFAEVVGVSCRTVRRFLRTVQTPGSLKFTDAELAHVEVFQRLQLLDLSDTEITDAGLTRLQGLTQLQQLRLDNTEVTDAGLRSLRSLAGLQTLHLHNTRVTEAGVNGLKQALPNVEIFR